MRRSGRLFIVLGVGLALVAILLVGLVLLSGDGDDGETTDAEPDEEPQEITVVVAARDVPAHTVLTQDDIEEQVVDSDTVPGDVLRSRVEAIGFAYSVDLVAGQPLLESNRELPGLANRVEPGRRAVALPVEPVNLVGGQLRDDDHVDIVFSTRIELLRINPTYPMEVPDNLELQDIPGESLDPEAAVDGDLRPPGVSLPEYGEQPEGPVYPYPGEPGSRFWITDTGNGEPVGKILLQNIRILRVVTPTDAAQSDTGDESFVILDLDPSQAELVDYLQQVGSYRLILRGPEDEDIVETPGVSMNQLVDNWGLLVPRTVRLPEAGTE